MSDLARAVADAAIQQQAVQRRRIYPTNAYIPFTKAEIEQSILARFEQHASRYPERLAIQTGSQTLTYAALNQAANRVARAILAQQGPGQDPHMRQDKP